MKYFLSKTCLAVFALLTLAFGSGKAQYDTFEVLRLQDRTIYIFPRGYVPNVGVPFAPVVNPWYVQPGLAAPVVASPGILPRDTVMPLSYTGATDTLSTPASTSITLRVPESAEVWIQGKKMDEKGIERRFNLPSLDPRTTHDYDIRVEWTENGRKKSDTAHLNVRAGDQQSITYIAAMSTSKASSGEAPGIQEEPGK
jgi:uncharacterized protein (TIGR03000 family)